MTTIAPSSASPTNLPLSTRIISTAGEKAQANVVSGEGPTPEDVNKAVNQASERVNEIQTEQQAIAQTRRDTAATLKTGRDQQQAIDQYIEATTGEETESTGLSAVDFAALSRSARLNTLATSIDGNDINRQNPPSLGDNRPPESPREQLQNLLDGVGRPDNPPTINIIS